MSNEEREALVYRGATWTALGFAACALAHLVPAAGMFAAIPTGATLDQLFALEIVLEAIALVLIVATFVLALRFARSRTLRVPWWLVIAIAVAALIAPGVSTWLHAVQAQMLLATRGHEGLADLLARLVYVRAGASILFALVPIGVLISAAVMWQMRISRFAQGEGPR
jgi:hypothetical protein